MANNPGATNEASLGESELDGPPINLAFKKSLGELVAVAKQGHLTASEFFNPPDSWIIARMPILQDMPSEKQESLLDQSELLKRAAKQANAVGKAATHAGPEVVVRLDSGGLAFFSQLGVARRPDLTQYFIDGFPRNRDALAFSEDNQALFADVFECIVSRMKHHFSVGNTIVQSDRQIGDAPGRLFHARQLLFGTRYLQIPYMWRQLTFEFPEAEDGGDPDILEVSIPNWLEELGMSEELKARIREAGLTQLIFKAPTYGLSLHLGFDYVGEHKMGPLSIAMFLAKQAKGLAIQAALSMARVKALDGNMTNTTLVTVGPSLHGKSTLTIMIELANSDFAKLLNLSSDPDEGVYPMNDDIVLLQPFDEPIVINRGPKSISISHGISGTENNFYAVPFGLTREEDPIAYDVVRGSEQTPNPEETLENVPVNLHDGAPDFLQNPVRNMRVILSRTSLLERKGVQHLLRDVTSGRMNDAVHVPMENTDAVFWQAVMRQNTVIPPLRRLTLDQYIRVLMYGEAVQMGAASGVIGKPYVEYFSDPFIIGLEDENANLMYHILNQMALGGMQQKYFVFNTGGIGADTNEEAVGSRYKKVSRELTLMLQEALLREAVKFEYDSILRSEVAVAIVNPQGEEVLDLRKEWLPREIYGEEEYGKRVLGLTRRRYYGRDSHDKAGILRYTKVNNSLMDIEDIPAPCNERELAWLLSFYWHVDQACDDLLGLVGRRSQGQRPEQAILGFLQQKYQVALDEGLKLSDASQRALDVLGIMGTTIE